MEGKEKKEIGEIRQRKKEREKNIFELALQTRVIRSRGADTLDESNFRAMNARCFYKGK